jgi:hypothetical protein
MDIPKTIISLAIPYPCDLGPMDRDEDFDKFFSMLNELHDLSGTLTFPFSGLGDCRPMILWLQDKSLIQQLDAIYQIPIHKECEHLVICLETPNTKNEDSESQLLFMVKYITNLLVLTNICHPGMVGLEASGSKTNGIIGYPNPIPKMDSISIQSGLLYAQKLSWPQIEDLKIADAWEWYLNQENFLEQEGFENDICTRALNAYARMFECPTQDVSMHLVWSMVGIEALYEQGKFDVMQQVRENIPQILGQYVGFKKEFNRMYESRSRFIHGDVDIPGLFVLGDAHPKYGQLDSDLDRTVSFAASILIASLQQIIKGNWPKVGFPPKTNGRVWKS